ncbi:toprim domain-containing protein [Nitrosospira sp. Nsp1]|uniref:toprim domain-containing protein n=1 Tax=Nitrosospira sp. Nsp1 TaxID=136547 RepID=UPI00088C4F3C|nr:toprim domain-containing protein [Nitrosospira sp. Nsp1]SCX40629.1 DNA primase [Nitrosospira sp. Nsp1]
MATIDELKQRIDLHDLAEWLGLERPGGKGNYKSPHHDDKSPSLSIYGGDRKYKDHSRNEGGTCIDMVCLVRGVDVGEAVKVLHEFLNIPLDKPERGGEPREKSRAEYIADRCLSQSERAVEYLTGRGITEEVIRRAIKKGTVGFNDWRSSKVAEGEPGHGGPAAAFIVRSLNPGRVMAVDLRYLDPAINGNVKTQCQGEKSGYGWTSDIRRLMNAKTVYFVESPINALSIECCDLSYSASYAIRGVGNADNVGLEWMKGKHAVIVTDNDKPDEKGHRPGRAAAWTLHERLTALDVAAMMVDQSEWKDGNDEPINDVNDYLRLQGLEALKRALWKLEPWLIQGQPGRVEEDFGKRRVYLPYHDDTKYWRYRVREDFTSYISEVKKDEDGNEKLEFTDLAGFRIASLSRVTIAGATATMSGETDTQPRTLFAISVQTPRHGANLVRRVVEDERLHNVDTWKKIGPVWNQSAFLRMVNILERGAHLGARNAANFVGLCYREGKLILNEGPDCYFTNPEQQCPYHNLTFPSGTRQDARKVIEQYQMTFKRNAATLPLVWGLGGHLKVLLGFWPHLMMQADKGHGKSTLIKRLERSIGFTMFSGQSLQTEFRLLTSISHTSHPVGWEELSARKQDIIDKAVGLLQENYQYTLNRRGTEMTEFLSSAPVMLAGEDVPVRSLIGKIVRTELTGKKGPLMPEDMPRFPVRQWIEFLTGLTRGQVIGVYDSLKDHCLRNSRASGADDGAVRMAGNYAALLTAWRFLCEFAEIDVKQGGFAEDVIAEMNAHITETSSDREPWVWILETVLSEIARNEFKYPYLWDKVDGENCLLVRTSHIMEHLAHTPALREKWNGLPVKSDRVFKKQIQKAGVIISDTVERTIGMRRISHLSALSLSRLDQFGLHATPHLDANF